MLGRLPREFTGTIQIASQDSIFGLGPKRTMINPCNSPCLGQVLVDDLSNVLADLPKLACSATTARIKLLTSALPEAISPNLPSTHQQMNVVVALVTQLAWRVHCDENRNTVSINQELSER
uniref:Uncharacterized protein n=1 Tax=Xanthomonas vasicola pv. vasculorum NCPPB 890 TaxID=1184265 RepID=A0A836ZTB9_XANVA